ncbi:MAG: 4-diphosphocytidyl-2C-methyl-D-erythritol kinase [Candidatus Eremiobacteraeota bacterium]|nr:4-diphosphocytidyl-2C-methyl-D-erythritol kinase [Candidatus Eremiobacteraeota bacterium]
MASQGGQANVSGNLLEHTVKNVFSSKGFLIVRSQDWHKSPDLFTKELLVTNVRYTSVYGHQGTTEFLLISDKHQKKIRIECKWQQVSGSVDEKLPYLYLNCIEAMPEDHIIIIIDGGGWKQGAVEWLRNAVREKKYTSESNRHKAIEVMSLTEFITWANREFK